MHELGYRVTAVSSVKGALANPDGLDIPALLHERAELGDDFVYNHPELAIEPGQELFTQADILVPAALQNVVNEHNVGDIKAKLVVEAANLPTNAAAQEAMREKGTTVVPDFIANAGGVVSAAFAMESRFSPFRVDPATILDTVSSKLRTNAVTTLEEAQRSGETTHEAARRLAQERVRAAMDLRGRRVPQPSAV